MYQFYLGGVLLPVTPSSITTKITSKNKTTTLINDGEINVLKRAGLSKFSFTAVLPNQEYPFARYEDGYKGAQYFLSHLENLKTGMQPFEFYILRTDDAGSTLISGEKITASLETYEMIEDATKYGLDVAVKLELMQYRSYGTKILEFKTEDGKTTATATEQRDTSTKPKEGDYTVVSGDNLWDIARAKLGDGTRMNDIYNLNKDIIEAAAKKYGRASASNGWWIYPGTVLKLPS